jgi:drug/metabolite transporter (DMT)-like permease
MDAVVFLVVLLAALFHATWNTFIKVDRDRLLFMAVLLASGGIGALSTTPFLPLPAPESWPYIALSILLHQGYTAFLLMAYRFGDLSHVYPLARGSAPLIVALLSVTLIGEKLSHHSVLAVVMIGAGIMSLSFTRGAQNLRNPWAVFFALTTGLFIAAYTLTDGVGARLAGSAHSYSAWMLGLEWIPLVVFVLLKRKARVLPQIGRVWKPAVLMGLMSLAAYWAVIWAMTVAPIALVAALRETGIIFALLFGVVFLKERLSLARLTATFTTLVGTIVLKMSRS